MNTIRQYLTPESFIQLLYRGPGGDSAGACPGGMPDDSRAHFLISEIREDYLSLIALTSIPVFFLFYRAEVKTW